MGDYFKSVGGAIIEVILLVFATYALVVMTQRIAKHKSPPVIEVYRGNTTLEITYKDGIPVDSVVVYKSNK